MQPACRSRGWARSLIVLGLLALAALPVDAASRFTVTVDPPDFTVDESAEMTITVTGDEDAVPLIPRVPGLVINPVGQSTSIRQVNGGVTAIFARTYRVTAVREGTFTIPPIQIGAGATAPVTVHVGAVGSLGSARHSPPAGATRAETIDVAKALREAMPMLKVVLPKARLYMGQLIPIQIKAYFREGVSVRLEGPLAAVGDAFTVSGLDKRPTQTQEALAGVDYTVLTWNSVLGALKSGDYPIGLELPVTLNIELPDSNPDMAARLRSLFGTRAPGAFMDDSVFGNLFGKVVQKSITLKADAAPVTVLPLPVPGRPANFSGAVGQFRIASELAPAGGSVGDPLTFKLTVSGRGNLSRVTADALQESSQWRVYRTEAKVTADDDTGLQGFKTFTQPVVPLQAGQLFLPGVSFSYFDPEAGHYETRQSQPILVTVTPGAGAAQSGAMRAGAAVAGAADNTPGDALAPDLRPMGSHVATLEPLIRQRWFIGAAVTPVMLMICAVALLRRQQLRAGDPALRLHAARLASVRINLEAMAAARQRGEAAAFFTAARRALQEKLADLWHIRADSVDSQQVAQRMPGDAAELQAILAMAEKATYGGESPGAPALQDWQRRVLEQMDRLERNV